jgi:bifunctional non-homologous end joining protein LigD
MRDFDATPEPSGEPPAAGDACRFVIQQHSATRLHWDLRLEHEGVLLSWAMPRGLPWSPDDNHLAVHTEDHPLEYLDFHGEIPEGSYGAGTMFVWDHGTYEPVKVTDTKLTVVLHGERAEGRYALFQTRGRDWMIHRMDPPADPSRRPVPSDLRPMEATSGPLPHDDDGWAYEVLWTGERALVTSSGGVVQLTDRAGEDVTASFPEVRRLGRHLGMTEVVLDGVVASPDPSVGRDPVDRRLATHSDSTIRRLARDHPLVVLAFDLLWLDGYPIVEQPWEQRREQLDALALEGDAWQAPTAHRGDGAALLDAVAQRGLRGIVAKRVDSTYTPGAPTDAWVRVDAPA